MFYNNALNKDIFVYTYIYLLFLNTCETNLTYQ